MDKQTIDCLGLPCPQPVLRAKEALDRGVRVVEVLIDNDASQGNLIRFARSQGHTASAEPMGEGHFLVVITAGIAPANTPVDPDLYACTTPTRPRLVYVISSDSMGRGSDQLGWALLQTYVQTIKEVEPLPEKIVLYNSGVKLVATASGALDALRDLQARGVEILACGTCLDFFGLKAAIAVGQISNMLEIMTTMAGADRLVSPL